MSAIRTPPEGEENHEAEQPKEDDEPGAWDEDFKSHRDSKPNGPGNSDLWSTNNYFFKETKYELIIKLNLKLQKRLLWTLHSLKLEFFSV